MKSVKNLSPGLPSLDYGTLNLQFFTTLFNKLLEAIVVDVCICAIDVDEVSASDEMPQSRVRHSFTVRNIEFL